MSRSTQAAAVQAIRDLAVPWREDDRHDTLLEMIGQARFVLLGEASHGTREFYQARAQITRRLITEKGFQAVAIEGDWPDAFRVNRHVRGPGSDASAPAALSGFGRFPRWMWRNRVVVDFVQWLRGHNHRCGIDRFVLPLRLARSPGHVLAAPRLELAIGVIYRPETERWSHYVSARLLDQFDALIHIDTTHALEPLDTGPQWLDAEAPETYPSGM